MGQCGALKQCTCANGGDGATGTDCPKDKEAKCVKCNGAYFLDGIECKAWTDCSAKSKTQKVSGSNIADAVCGEDFQCACANGTPATGAACPSHGGKKCVSCRGKYYLAGGSCVAWRDCDSEGKVETKAASNTNNADCGDDKQCECKHGTGASGTDCEKDGDAKCVKCDDSYWLGSDHKCKKWTDCDALGKQTLSVGTNTEDSQCGAKKVCRCPNGVGATGIKCPNHNGIMCSECSVGFFLEGSSCKPHRDCDMEGRLVKLAGTRTTDTLCGADKRCTCNEN